ncbi:MAG TPA: hypothetical protein VK874_08985 [Gaiellaceae bacterium]|nr:hypothetical protein [Gaiellaceae bacterium]
MTLQRLFLVMFALVLVASVAAISGRASARGVADDGCTWGASSMTAFVEDGQVVESAPSTSGCIPGR